MKYIEIIVLLNVLIHLILVIVSAYISEIKLLKWLVLLSMIIDCLYVIGYVYIPYELEAYKYLLIFMISFVPFVNRQFIKTVVGMLIYLLLNFCFGGLAGFLYGIINKTYVVIGGILLLLIVIILCSKLSKREHKNKELFYEIIIEYNNDLIAIHGYCDTGNMVVADYVIPVVFLQKKYKIGRYYKSINITSVNLNSNVDIYMIDSFRIKVNDRYIKKRVYLAYADIRYDAIFGVNILGG